MKQGGAAEVPGISDIGRFEELAQSLGVMRIEGEEQESIWRMVIAILHLGNIEFVKDDQGFCSVDPKTTSHLEMCAKLFGIDAAGLQNRLTTTTLKVGRKAITKKIQFKNGAPNRDSIAKGAYENTFLYLARRINQELCNLDEDIDKLLFIGVLDVFGFENFKYNSLEQFCINFTNEKLQEFFNYHIIAAEQEEYIRESVVWTEIEVPSSKQMLDLVEKKITGFFAILDSACQAPKPDVEAFHQEFFKKNSKNSLIGRYNKKKKKNFFGIEFKHFADNVKYDLREFIAKNMEKLHSDTKKMFNTSDVELVKRVAGGRVKKTRGFKSVTSVFSKALNLLMTNLKATEPYFVRCVNPNKKKTGTFFNRKVVEDQLRCGGIIEALRVLKLGYPTRVSYEIIYNKYHPRITHPLLTRMGPDKFAAAILIAFGVDETEYELGLTKIFFRPAKAAVLDEIMEQADNLSQEQMDRVLSWLAKRRKLQLFGMLKISRFYDEKIRHNRAMEKWHHVGQVTCNLAMSLIRYLEVGRERIEERRQNAAAVVISSYWKAYAMRNAIEKRKRKVQKAVKKIWRAHKQYENRQKVMSWLEKAVEETRERKRREEEERRRREEEERRRKAEEERLERERIAAMDAEKRAAEEARLAALKAEQERQRLEAERIEKERLRKEAEEKAQREREEAERKAAEEAERKRVEEEERRRLEEDAKKKTALTVEKARVAQRQKSVVEDKRAAAAAKKRAQEKRNKRKQEAYRAVDARWEEEEEKRLAARDVELEKVLVNTEHEYPDEMSSSDNELYDDIFGMARPVDFRRVAANGTLFMKHTGRKKHRAPQDRFVKVTFDQQKQVPTRISWGSGSRHLDFSEIKLIAWGHHSPTFVAKASELDPRTCFSIVSQHSILDLQNTDVRVVEQWVRGLRDLIGQNDEDAAQLSRELREHPPRQKRSAGPDLVKPSRRENKPSSSDGRSKKSRDRRRSKRERVGRDGSSRRSKKTKPLQEEHKKRTKSLMLLQQDLFVMTTTTVFRNLEEDDYPVTQRLKDSFNPKEMYEKALANDVPWRQWQNWIHEQIIQKMIEQGSIQPQTKGPGPRAANPAGPDAPSGAILPGDATGKNKEECVI